MTANNATSHAQKDLRKVKTLVAVYGAFGTAALAVVVVLAVTGNAVSGFMWGRAAGMFVSALVAHRLTALAQGGSRPAYLRVRVISVVMPIAVIAIDGVPGILSPWFAALQIAGALALLPAAFLTNGRRLRSAFSKKTRSVRRADG
jgi:hypothetical protein